MWSSNVILEMKTLDSFSRMDNSIQKYKSHINFLEANRILGELKTLKDDEIRLKNCIQSIEEFHRDMFVLKKDVNKTFIDLVISRSLSDLMNQPWASMNEPGSSMNEPMSSMNEPMSSMNEQNPSRKSLDIKIPKFVYNLRSSRNKSNQFYGLNGSSDETGDVINKSGNGEDESSFDMDESCNVKDESSWDLDELFNFKDKSNSDTDKSNSDTDKSNSDTDKSNSDTDKSSSDTDKSSYVKDESSYVKDESNDIGMEMAKEAILNHLADEEKEITELVLHLIYTFSCFQLRLRKAEKSVTSSTKFFPSGSSVNVKRTVKALSGSVLYLDNIASRIFRKYSEMLANLGEKYE